MTAHNKQFNIRVTDEEDDLLDKFYIFSMAKRGKRITRAAFIREQLLKLCKKLPKEPETKD